MPYILPKNRKKLDDHIDKLVQAIVDEAEKEDYDAAFTGLLNYTFTRIALKVARLRFGKMRYWIIAAITGVFKNASDEFYRRIAVPYEDKQIEKNGDVEEYKEYSQEIDSL